MSIVQLHSLIINGEKSCLEITREILARIDKLESKINAFITITPKDAIRKAKEVDRKVTRGENIHLLAGIPVAIKDSFLTKGIKTTVASRVLENYIGQYDATVVEKLKKNDAVIVGKTNLDEFSLGFTTETSVFGPTSNPWDITRTPGGSSGGSAAAVASGESIYSIGSEHYDSIRQPAAWCGVVGFKPTYGLVSRYGIVAMASSLECPGPITKTVEDAAIVLDVLSGFDIRDANSLKVNINNYFKNLKPLAKNIKIGIAKEYFSSGVEKDVLKVVQEAIKTLKKLGSELVEISLPSLRETSTIFEVLYRAEVASNLARYDGVRYGGSIDKVKSWQDLYLQTRKNFGPLLKQQMLTDLRALSGGEFESIYDDALKLRRLVINEFSQIFKNVDLIVSPMSPCIAFKKGFYRKGKYYGNKQTDSFRPVVDIIAQLPALCGFPGISIPCGFSKNLPVGLQIYGPLFSEQLILNTAYAYERATSWNKMMPNLP